MFCPNCGTKLDDNAVFCTSCGVRLAQEQPGEPASATPAAPEAPAVPETPHEEGVWQETPEQAPKSQDVWQQAEPGASSGSEQPPNAAVVAPPDYLTINIILTVVSFFACCFSCVSLIGVITGIIGIVSASGVRSAMSAGDYAQAEQKSRTAKNMWIATAIILGVSILFGILFMFLGFSGYVTEMLMSYY